MKCLVVPANKFKLLVIIKHNLKNHETTTICYGPALIRALKS